MFIRLFEVRLYDTTKRFLFAKNRQEIWKKYSGDVKEIVLICVL